jgi:hypothetical protein
LRALDLAFVDADRLVVLDGAEIALISIGGPDLVVLSRRPLPGPLAVVRAAGGLLQASETESAVWAMTSRSPQAALYAVEGSQLAERERADALPFPGAARGLRFRAGTNLIEAEVAGLGAGPFLDVAGAGAPAAVEPEGRIRWSEAGTAKARAGATLAALWPGTFATSRPTPPEEADALVVYDAGGTEPVLECPLPGPVRAIAARLREDSARLAVAVDGPDGRAWLHVVPLARPRR